MAASTMSQTVPRTRTGSLVVMAYGTRMPDAHNYRNWTVPGRSRAVNKLLRGLTRSLRSGTGEPKEQVQRLAEQIAAQARMAVG